jgi:predicted nucleic acid-binding protein
MDVRIREKPKGRQMRRIRGHYLDASALLKLFIDEEGSEQVRHYFNEQTVFFTTSLCFGETLGRLKVEYKKLKHITQERYLHTCYELMAYVAGEKIAIQDIEIANRETYLEVEELGKKYDLDISDAFQIVTLKKGFLSVLGGKSKSMLITGDSGLANAVRQEGFEVWDCLREPPPPN